MPELQALGASADIEFATGNYAVALGLYERLAATGDARASEFAGYMLYFGGTVFSSDIPCDRERAARWLRIAAQHGHDLAQMLLERIDK